MKGTRDRAVCSALATVLLYLCARIASCGCMRAASDGARSEPLLEAAAADGAGSGGGSSEAREARRWVRNAAVTWRDMLRYILVASQVAIEGIVSFFNSEHLFQRVSVILESSGQRVRASKSIDNYGIVVRFGRTLSSISDMVMSELFEKYPGVFDSAEASAEGDDLVERLHSVQVAVTADLVGPRLLALDRAVIRVLVCILAVCAAAVMFAALYWRMDILISRWLASLVTQAFPDLVGPEDGTSLYRCLVYIIIVFYAAIMFLAIFSMVLLNALLSACANIMLDLTPASVERVLGSHQKATGSTISRDRAKDAFGRTMESIAAASSVAISVGRASSSTNFRSIFKEKVSWLRFAEPADMRTWWAQLQIDVDHCRQELSEATASLLAIVNLGASILVSFLLIAFSVTVPLLQKILIGAALCLAIICGLVAGYYTGASRSYAIVVLSEVSRHMDAVFDSDSEYKRVEDGAVASCVGCLCHTCLPKSETPVSLNEWLRRNQVEGGATTPARKQPHGPQGSLSSIELVEGSAAGSAR